MRDSRCAGRRARVAECGSGCGRIGHVKTLRALSGLVAFVREAVARSASGLVPLAISTVNGSPVRRAPTVTLICSRPASRRRPRSFSSEKPVHRSPRRSRTQASLCSLRSSSSTRPPGTTMRAASAIARAGSLAWWRACESRATSTLASSIGSFSSSPFFQVTFDTRRRAASSFARSRTAVERSTAITFDAQRLASIVR